MRARPYQDEFIEKSLAAWEEERRIMSVGATGMGKTIVGAKIIHRLIPQGARCLFLADATELVLQNTDKYHKVTGDFAAVEMAEHKADLRARAVIASAQSIHNRLAKYAPDHFTHIIVDECHRNTLGGMSQKTLNHFPAARVLGVTATPYRSDRKQLGDFYKRIAVEISLERLIREGWLSRITLKCLPLKIDVSKVSTKRGPDGADFNLGELGEAVEPHLLEAARLIQRHAPGRRTVVFLPLVHISKKFAAACQSLGLRAVHVDGDERDAMGIFARGEADVICNASLLTTGWDCPLVDCIMILRPTKSLSLFQQMVGRGTRPIYASDFDPNADFADVLGRRDAMERGPKRNLLMLDPLFATDDMKICTPARLMIGEGEVQAALEARLRGDVMDVADMFDRDAEEIDLLDAGDSAVSEAARMREEKLKRELSKQKKKKPREVDAMEFFLALNNQEIAQYTPEHSWEAEAPTEAQVNALEKLGFGADEIKCKGQASALLDLCRTRADAGLASPKQVRKLRQIGHPSPDLATAAEAGRILSALFVTGRVPHHLMPAARPQAAPEPIAEPLEPAPQAPRYMTPGMRETVEKAAEAAKVKVLPRQWTSIAGNTVQGTAVAFRNGVAKIRLKGGRLMDFPAIRFVESDRVLLSAAFAKI